MINIIKVKNYIKTLLLFSSIFIIYLVIISIFYYFEIFSYKAINIINYIVMILLFFLLGYKIAILEGKKGYLNGFLISSILIILFAILSLIFSKLDFSSLVYYLSLILTSITAGIIGVRNK